MKIISNKIDNKIKKRQGRKALWVSNNGVCPYETK